MPRFARVVIPECPHHITQRGNERRDIFFTPADRAVYPGILKHYAQLCAVDVLGLCLMTNHLDLILRPMQADSLARLMRHLPMRYSQYRHAVERGGGHLWQNRYYSCPVEPRSLGPVMRYVERNPVRAGLARTAAEYRWSSAATHLDGPDPWKVLSLTDWREPWTPQEWARILHTDADDATAIRQATYGGRPLGSDEFTVQLEQQFQRPLKRRQPGRPRKLSPATTSAAAGEL